LAPRFALSAAVAVGVVAMGMHAHAQVSNREMLEMEARNLGIPQDAEIKSTSNGVVAAMPSMEMDSDAPVTLAADEMGYDQANAIVVARGNVEVVQGPYILNADQLTYFQRSNFVRATGNVSMLQPNGDVFFAEKMDLRDDMRQGVIRQFKARLADNSVFAANEARRLSPNVTELKKAAYTPCHLCEGMAPFWELKASEVKIDQMKETVTYHGAQMNMMGVPFLYTPYLKHPTPDAEAKSGLLTPEYQTGNNLGTVVRVPYYWRISPDKEITLTPWYSTEVGSLLEGDYLQKTNHGEHSISFSGTFPEELDSNGNAIGGNDFRGHIYAKGMEPITDYSRVGYDIARASDDTYLRRYRFGSERVLFSRAYVEAAQGRNYALAQGLTIQGLRATDNADTTPLVLPTLEGYYETKPYDNGLRLHASANAQSLTRDIGVDQNRLSITGGATLPMVTDGGHIFTATGNVRQDMYDLGDVPLNGGGTYNGTKGRVIPQAALEWRYPLIRNFGSDALTVEPIMLGVAQPNGNNPIEILNANEDNTLIELNDTNIFSINRMPGLDTVDSGSRIAYGFRSQYLFTDGYAIDTLLGQSYNFDNDTPFPNSTKPGENVSDIIGRVAFEYQPYTLSYRFAIDRDTFAANRNEIGARYQGGWLTLGGSYRSVENNRYLVDSEEATATGSIRFSDEWSVFGGGRRDMDLNQMIATQGGVIYRNECFTLMLQAMRTYTRDRDIEPSTDVTLRVGFKNLGEFGD